MVRMVVVPSRSTSPHRGEERLVWDCSAVGRVLELERPPARVRLEAELGERLTRLLLATLRESEPATPHEQRLWRAAQGDAA
jgi:hypothetical protein